MSIEEVIYQLRGEIATIDYDLSAGKIDKTKDVVTSREAISSAVTLLQNYSQMELERDMAIKALAKTGYTVAIMKEDKASPLQEYKKG